MSGFKLQDNVVNFSGGADIKGTDSHLVTNQRVQPVGTVHHDRTHIRI